MVTDPGSPLDEASRAAGYRVVNADPEVGGRFSALTAFGLVPSGLAGADVERLLDDAEVVADLLAADDEGNPGLRLGAAVAGTEPLRDKLVLLDGDSGLPGFAAWAEQLVAESTGKHGTGILPVVVDDVDSPEVARRLERRHRRHPGRGLRPARPGHRPEPGHRLRVPRRPAAAVGGRHGRRRAADGDQPLRPARRRERQAGRSAASWSGRPRRARRCSPTAR